MSFEKLGWRLHASNDNRPSRHCLVGRTNLNFIHSLDITRLLTSCFKLSDTCVLLIYKYRTYQSTKHGAWASHLNTTEPRTELSHLPVQSKQGVTIRCHSALQWSQEVRRDHTVWNDTLFVRHGLKQSWGSIINRVELQDGRNVTTSIAVVWCGPNGDEVPIKHVLVAFVYKLMSAAD